MALPVVQFERGEGSDGDTTSGAGPAVGVNGTKAHTRVGVSSPRVGLFETSAVTLSLVAVDGSHAVRLASVSGRKWAKITAKKESRQSTTGDMTASSAVLSNLGSTTSMSVDDPISVAGAGAAGGTLYSEISSVDSGTQVTLKDNASGTVTGAAVLDPERVTIEDSLNLGTTDIAWGIGGRRDDPWASANTQLFSDYKAGWVLELLAINGTYTTTSTRILTVSGNVTDGRIRIRGAGATRPRITANNSTSPFTLRAVGYDFSYLDFDDVDAGILIDSSATEDVTFVGLSQTGAVGVQNLVRITSAATGDRFYFRDFLTRKVASAVLIQGEIRGALFGNSIFSDLDGGSNGDGIKITSNISIRVRSCIFHRLGNGITHSGTAINYGHVMVENSIFEICAKGFTAPDVDVSRGLIFRNNVLRGSSGIALELGANSDNIVSHADYNCFFDNATNRSGISAGPNDVAIDPEWTNPEVFDFRSKTLAIRQIGWPRQTLDGETKTRVDLGYAEAPIALGGTVLCRIVQVNDLGDEWEVQFDVLTGAAKTARQAVRVVKANAPTGTTPHDPAIVAMTEAFLRDGSSSSLLGLEILV